MKRYALTERTSGPRGPECVWTQRCKGGKDAKNLPQFIADVAEQVIRGRRGITRRILASSAVCIRVASPPLTVDSSVQVPPMPDKRLRRPSSRPPGLFQMRCRRSHRGKESPEPDAAPARATPIPGTMPPNGHG